MLDRTLIIFARQPVPGATKTRLCPPLTPATASALYAAFLHDTLDRARGLSGVGPVVAYTPATAAGYFAELAPDLVAEPQRGDDLGERMERAIAAALQRANAAGAVAPSVVLVGSDSPDLPAAHLVAAFEHLEAGADVVLGPSSDGGYYLVGVRRPQPRLLRDVPMSTPTVLADTLAVAAAAGLAVALLPPWHDVDTAADLARLVDALRQAPPAVAPHTRAFLDAHPQLRV